MAQILPITLLGDNLGQRHRYLNSQLDQAVNDVVSFQDIKDLPEETPVDRLFKIELAIKLKNVDYLLENIKDDDMLYVSRALKCKWLLERRDLINPKYLEDVLYPDMVLPAISKMKHWLYINLREPSMCQEFYQYYKDTDFDFAVKFLHRCNNEFVMNEFPNILIKLTPHNLKVLCEQYPKLVKLYFDSLATDNELVKRYLNEEQFFYNNIKCVLKLEPDMFLDITEKYHSLSKYNKFSPSATDYILRCHKTRFMAKAELYVVHLLHLPTVARCLSVEECQDVVIKLARADYISQWFSYANVEPLIKRVSRDERAAFKKRVFVEKDIGEHVTEWPYVLPASPVPNDNKLQKYHVFYDETYDPIYMLWGFDCRGMLKKRKFAKWGEMLSSSKSELQKLFDEFRYVGFERTFHELNRRVGATSSADRRRDMLLVLVSKSGGRADAVRVLMQLAMKLHNEPVHERAAVVRSLTKRASAWRLPQDVWDTMLEYGRGLGLDGAMPEAECREGLHAVVIRQLIEEGDCVPCVRTAFLDGFSTLAEYKFIPSERQKVTTGLQNILVTSAADAQPKEAANRLEQLLDVLQQYHIRFESSSVVSAVAALAQRDFEVTRELLARLYKAGAGRRELIRHYLKLRHDDAALLNALRHDLDAISPHWLVKLLNDGETRANQFLLKLTVYFREKGGYVEQLRQALLDNIAQNPDKRLARPLAMLADNELMSLWRDQRKVNVERYKLAAALQANMHLARPAPDALVLGWREAGMNAVAWRASRCRSAHVTQLAQMLLEKREKRTVRLALMLAQRTKYVVDTFLRAVDIRPFAVLRAALIYFRKFGDAADPRIWDIIKPLFLSVDLIPRRGLRSRLCKLQWIPRDVKPDYSAILYLALDNISERQANIVLRELMNHLHGVSDDLVEKVMLRMLAYIDKKEPASYPAIIIRYLMLSKSDSDMETRFAKIVDLFLEKLYTFNDTKDESRRYYFSENMEQIIASLKYNYAFFDINYQSCLSVIERVKSWMEKFMPKEIYFEEYVKIYATMLYYKAIRQSMKQKPEVFEDPVKKMSEGVDIVGFTFGRYIAKELSELMSEHFESIIEIYLSAFVNYLDKHFMYDKCRNEFTVAIIKGILSEGSGREPRLAIPLLQECQSDTENRVEEIKELIMKNEQKETQFFFHAQISL